MTVLKGDVKDEVLSVYDALYPSVFGYCACRLFKKDLAEDAASEVFLRLVERFPSLADRSTPGIKKWLYGTASNIVARQLRDVRRQTEIRAALAAEGANKPENCPTALERLDWPILYQAIGRLNHKHREIIILRFFQGMHPLEIAEVLGMKHVTARVLLGRAVEKLRRDLEQTLGECPRIS